MDGPPIVPDDERELRELRARAYGREPDILDDPVGLARLAELEDRRVAKAASRVEGEASTEVEPSPHAEPPGDSSHLERPTAGRSRDSEPPATGGPSATWCRRRMASKRSRPIWLGAGAGVAVVAIVWGVSWLREPRPTAALASTADRADEEVLALVAEYIPLLDIDTTTLASYETYRGVEPWSARDEFDNPCLVLIDRSADAVLEAACTPEEGQLIADIAAWPASGPAFAFAEGLPDGSIIRFRHRGDTVDAFLIIAPGGD
ncbi:hypothetical protein [Agromyces sp. Marseille-Q5079]|uniref:hypothetical protein n=1 Tax=Agromyces sp. Marseille-Q5079 TaxID=3439059 RepID=UPI003D9C976A